MTISEALRLGGLELAKAARSTELEVHQTRREARWLLGLSLGLEEASILAFPERELDQSQVRDYQELVARRASGVPFAYLAGRREFAGLELLVDDRVLVPRPETEHLVEAALALLADQPHPLVLDLGTGSGNVAIAIAASRPGVRVLAVELDPGAAALARRNVHRHQLGDRVGVIIGDWATALDAHTVDLVVSNPPYIAVGDPEVAFGVRSFEPALALWAGSDGLAALEALLASLARAQCRAPVLSEIGARQGAQIGPLAAAFGRQLIALASDLAGLPRIAHLSSPALPLKD